MRNKTSFTPATAPKGKGGSKHHTTRVKEAVGLANFQTLIDFVDGEGADRFLRELEALEGRDYIAAYLKLLEFVKPKPKAEDLSKMPLGGGVDGFILQGDDGDLIDSEGRRYIPEGKNELTVTVINTGVPLASREEDVIP